MSKHAGTFWRAPPGALLPGIEGGMANALALSINEAARTLSIGRSMLYRLIRDKHLAAMKIGRRTVIATDELRRFMEAIARSGLPRA